MAVRLDEEVVAELDVQKPYDNGNKKAAGQDYVKPLDTRVINAEIGYDITPEQECHDGGAHEVEGVCDRIEVDLRNIAVNDPADFV